MKNKLLALVAALGLVGSASAVKINDNLSINGFIDGSYSNTDTGSAVDTSDIDVDEVELNFLVNAGNVSGELHIDSGETNSGADLDIEQVHFTYGFDNGVSIQLGQFGYVAGFEREDPAGLYTFSRAYTDEFSNGLNQYNIGDVDNNLAEGLRISYAAEDFTVSLGLTNSSIDNPDETTNVEDDLDYELAVSYTGIDNLVINAGIFSERTDDGLGATPDIDTYSINAAYTIDKLLIGGEYINREEDGADDTSAYMILADYDVNDKLGVAVRYSEYEVSATNEYDKLTFAPNYAITESLGAILEFSTTEQSGAANVEVDSMALELTFTF
jgi:hypothetical protein